MKTIIRMTFGLFLAATFFSFTFLLNPPKKWEVDKAHSAITFSIKHFFTPVNGRFDKFEGEFLFDPENLKESKADFTIDVASVNTQNGKRDQHLQSPDFFNAEEFPKIKFTSTSFQKKKKEYVMNGKLTQNLNFKRPNHA